MATMDVKESLDYWRKFFSSAKSDLFELIDKAIIVAATDHPNEFKDRKDLIVEKLHTCHLSLCLESDCVEHKTQSNGDEGGDPKEVENSSNIEIPEENQIDGEVMRIKEILRNHENESDSVMYESLRSLELMKLSVETLMATEIGRTVNALRKHSSGHIGKLAQTLIKCWKVLVDEWLNSTTTIAKNTTADSVIKPSTTDSGHGGSSKLTSEQKPRNHLSSGVKRMRSEDVSETSKLEVARKKLHEGYQRIENAKKQRQIQIIELRDLPKESREEERSKKKLRKSSGI